MRILPLALLVLTALTALTLPGCSEVAATTRPGAELPAIAGVPVATAAYDEVPETIEAVGTVKSVRQVVLSARLTAPVTSVRVREGDRVRSGQPLVGLDGRDVDAALLRATAAEAEAREGLSDAKASLVAAERAADSVGSAQKLASANFERASYLVERKAIPAQSFDEAHARVSGATAELAKAEAMRVSAAARLRQAQARLERAGAELALARLTASYAQVLAPVDGVIVARSVEPGDLASPGSPLLTLEQERYRLEASVRDSEGASMRPGLRATVSLDTLGQTTSAVVTELVPSGDPLSRTSIVKLELQSMPGLRSGLYGKALFPAGTRRSLVVPAAALVLRGQLTSVFALDSENVARMRLVTVGKLTGPNREVLSGLDAGERVVSGGVERVTDSVHIELLRR